MKKIILIQVSAAVEQALREQLSPFGDLEVVALKKAPPGLSDLMPDLVLLEGREDDVTSAFPGCPVLPLSWARPWRLGALLRQIGQMLSQPVLYIDEMAIGSYLFKPQERSLTRPGGEEISLTDREVDILAYLVRHGGRPVSREDLLRNVWQYQEGVDTHTLETHIYRLRQKIELQAEDPRILLTAEGGYSLHPAKTAV